MLLKTIRLLLLTGIFMSGLSASVWAGEIRLENGDRLTGEIVKMDADVIVLKTVYPKIRQRLKQQRLAATLKTD